MEGYYWRLSDPASGRCVIALCGVCRAPDGPWAVVALASHPGGFVRWRATAWPPRRSPARSARPRGRPTGRRCCAATSGASRSTSARTSRLEAVLEGRAGWPHRLGALGLAHAVPGLPQYWQPAVLAARVRGEAVLAGETVSLDGWDAYVEKNWGGRFPGEWWWGQAALGDGAMAAFAGGRLGLGPLAASAIVVRVGRRGRAPSRPRAALVVADAGGGEWRLRARSPRWSLSLEGSAATAPHILPVPVPAERRAVMRSEHHLAGRMGVVLRRGRRVVLRAESEVAGLEHGTPG